jgi:hypothetical protein
MIENRRLVKKLYATRKADNPPFAGSERYEVMKAGIVMPKEKHNEFNETRDKRHHLDNSRASDIA